MSNAANAVTLSGYDTNPVNDIRLLNPVNSQTAFGNFSANLDSATVTTESFETTATPNGSFIDGLTTQISGITANFSYKKDSGASANGGASTQVQQTSIGGVLGNGAYPTDNVRFISINSSNNLSINFSSSIAAFGYFGTDLGDSGNILTMQFFNANNTLVSSQVIGSTGSANSSQFFFGFIADSPSEEFNRVVFSNSASNDAIGIDQIKIATPTQVKTKIPEPASVWGTLLCGGCLVAIKRRLKRV
ncbi:hypothetical protein [Chamaesiphon sp. VAR_69_metabat_338]|uniref:hypothetical protein n=1 Tax=Chamaesiphon sp. VAR_69_metabat_338 TaxID=2964704 RepID=UPI00286E0599|nr:hypothetical protein [Chamaesiphon sp. VAR_69_metabat_338]